MSVADAPTFSTRKSGPYQRFDPVRVIGRMTLEAYMAFERAANKKHAFVHGKVVEVAGASYEHNVICGNLIYAVQSAVEALSANCVVLPADQRVSISEQIYYYPDITIVCGTAQVDDFDTLHNPAVIIEVLSPSTEREDRTEKLRDYQQIESLRHYILIDQYAPSVTHYEKTAGGLWSVAGIHTDLSESLSLTLNDRTITVPLSGIYRRIEFTEKAEATPGTE